MAKWNATFLQTEGLPLRLFRFVRSSGEEHRLRHDRFFFRGRFPRYARAPARLLEWSQADALITVTHQILLFRSAPGQNPKPGLGSSRVGSLQLRWKLADQILDLFCFVSVTDQKRVLSSNNDEIMNSKKCDGHPILFENDVVAGIERSDDAIRGVSLLVFLKIIRHCSPASNVVPVETCLDYKNAVRLFHDRIIEGDPRQFAEAVTQSV